MRLCNAPGRLLFAVLLCLLAVPCFGQGLTAFTGRVTAVPEGDVIAVTDGAGKEFRVRLAGIDAPEMRQDFGPAARDFLRGLVLDQPVTIVGRRYDTAGRLVAQVFLLGRDVSYSMLWAGLAWYDKNADDDQTKEDRKRYLDGEKFARGKKDNIWSQARAVAPWDFRKENPAPAEPERTLALTPLSQPISQPAQAAALPPAASEKPAPAKPTVEIVGNKNSKIYHWNPGCPGFSKIADQNRVPFSSKEAAEAAGYRPAKNCKEPSPAN